MTCKQCRDKTKCEEDAFIHGATFDPYSSAKYCTGFEPITNADRIRAMSDEELAENITEFLCSIEDGVEYHNGQQIWLEWLQQPAEEG